MKEVAAPVKVFKDDNDYFIWGFHFFNQDERMSEFQYDVESLLDRKDTSIKALATYANKLQQTIKKTSE